MNKSEIYLIIFWENSGISNDQANNLINQEGFNCTLCDGVIPLDEQLTFIKKLYYQSVTNFKSKIKRVGAGRITVGVVEDSNPDYGLIHTTRGYSNVNRNILNLKKKLRSYAKVADSIHLSDTKKEAEHNLFITFSKTYLQLEKSLTNLKFLPKKITNIKDVYSILTVSMDYVVQRNFHEIFDRENAEHGDIDLLVSDPKAAALVVGAEPFSNNGVKLLYKVKTLSKELIFDIHSTEDGYYPQSWAVDIFKRKELSKCERFFKPSDEDLIYMVAYHALFHKFDLKEKYLNFIKEQSLILTDKHLDNWDVILQSLSRFLTKNKYGVSIPNNKGIKLNPFNFISASLIDSVDINRKSFLPEHHARNFVKMIKECPTVIYEKTNSLAKVTVLTSQQRPFNKMICKIVRVKDVKFAPYLLNEYFQLELYGNRYAPKVFSWFFDDGKYHLLMERINGMRLDHLLEKNNDFFIKNKETILRSLYSAENFLKNKGIQHRDIRETNIFITPEGGVKLIDFGLSCSVYDKNAPLPEALANTGNDTKDFARLRSLYFKTTSEFP